MEIVLFFMLENFNSIALTKLTTVCHLCDALVTCIQKLDRCNIDSCFSAIYLYIYVCLMGSLKNLLLLAGFMEYIII